jgi:hypothetical protein
LLQSKYIKTFCFDLFVWSAVLQTLPGGLTWSPPYLIGPQVFARKVKKSGTTS